MVGVLNFARAAEYCFLAFVGYKIVELGPYEAAALLGHCVNVFLVAARGYL